MAAFLTFCHGKQQLIIRTGWIRVMTPDGGGGGSVSANRGFVFIPEVGDHVLVGFRHGDPNRPYVMGSLFNGRTGKGGGEGNCCKSITTRSGSTLAMNDETGSVRLADPGKAWLGMDGAGNTTTSSKNNCTISAGNSHVVNAGANYATNVGKGASCLQMDADGNILLEGKSKITIKVGENTITISEEGIVTNAETGDVKSTAATGAVAIESKASEATFKGSTNTNVGGGDCTFVTGGDVEVNQS